MTQSAPPIHRGLPVIGNAHRLARNPLRFREDLAEQQYDLVETSFGRTPVYVVFHPDYVEEVFVTDSQNYVKSELMRDQLRGVFGDGLLLSDGDLWEQEKQLIQPSFQRQQVKTYTDTICRKVAGRIDSWADGDVIDLEHVTKVLTYEILMESLFHSDIPYEQWELVPHIEAIAERYKLRNLSFYAPDWVPTGVNREYNRALEVFDAFVKAVLRERRERDDDPEDLLSAMRQARNDPDHPMDDDLLRDEILTLVLGGIDPTTLVVLYSFYLLDENPNTRRTLEREVDEVLDGSQPTFDDLSSLEYTEAVLKEAMRLYPPFWQQVREPVTDVTIGPYEIPEGSIVELSAWGIHHDERWWEDPESFDPDRWNDERAGDRPAYAYFPFSGGRRQCVGRWIAMIEAKSIIAMVSQQYRLEPTVSGPLDLSVSTHMSPQNGLDVQIHSRSS